MFGEMGEYGNKCILKLWVGGGQSIRVSFRCQIEKRDAISVICIVFKIRQHCV